jgi:hypothetical protein
MKNWKVVHVHVAKEYWGSSCIAPPILNVGPGWRWVVNCTTGPLYLRGKSPWYPLNSTMDGSHMKHLHTNFNYTEFNHKLRRNNKKCFSFFFHIHAIHLDIFKVFYSPTDAQLNCLKNYFKIYIKIDIKTAPTCFGVITIIRERIIRAC